MRHRPGTRALRRSGAVTPWRRSTVAAAVAALALAGLAGCSDDKEPPGTPQAARTIGQGEGALELLALPGYVEAGYSDPRVDWVRPFEDRTKCRVNLRTVRTADELVSVMSNPENRIDGVAASPEATGRLIAGRQVAPVNPDLVDGFKDLDSRLRAQLRHHEKAYGVPFVWGADLLMYDPQVVRSAPSSWAALFDPDQTAAYSGRLIMRDSPFTLATAALYLKNRDKPLKIGDPFALTPKQLDAAREVIVRQRQQVKTFWSDPTDAINEFAGGGAVLGEGWPYHVDVLGRAGRSIAGVTPREGVTGWLSSWMIGARAEHPNCAYQWLTWITSPDTQQQVAEWNGVAPANPKACSQDRLKAEFCRAYHVNDRDYISKVMFARTPTRDCDGEGDAGEGGDCTDYAEWTRAWRGALSSKP